MKEFNKNGNSLDWDNLKKEVADLGMRDVKLMAIAPSEWNAPINKISGCLTAGIEPIADIIIGVHHEPLDEAKRQCMILKNRHGMGTGESIKMMADFGFEPTGKTSMWISEFVERQNEDMPNNLPDLIFDDGTRIDLKTSKNKKR